MEAQGVRATRAINYEGAEIIYKLKIINDQVTPIAKVSIKPMLTSDLFHLDRESASIDLVTPGNGESVTFRLRPQGECGNVSISADIAYYDMNANTMKHIDVEPKETAVVCPLLKRKKIEL